jgi:hypothetical protein
MDKLEDKGCHFINQDTGERCKGFHQVGSLYCFSHDPDKVQERAVAVKRGGESRAFVVNLAPIKIDKIKDVTIFITRTLNEVRKGDLPPQVANSFFYGANILLKSFELTELENKVEELEKLLNQRG